MTRALVIRTVISHNQRTFNTPDSLTCWLGAREYFKSKFGSVWSSYTGPINVHTSKTLNGSRRGRQICGVSILWIWGRAVDTGHLDWPTQSVRCRSARCLFVFVWTVWVNGGQGLQKIAFKEATEDPPDTHRCFWVARAARFTIVNL